MVAMTLAITMMGVDDYGDANDGGNDFGDGNVDGDDFNDGDYSGDDGGDDHLVMAMTMVMGMITMMMVGMTLVMVVTICDGGDNDCNYNGLLYHLFIFSCIYFFINLFNSFIYLIYLCIHSFMYRFVFILFILFIIHLFINSLHVLHKSNFCVTSVHVLFILFDFVHNSILF